MYWHTTASLVVALAMPVIALVFERATTRRIMRNRAMVGALNNGRIQK